MKYFDKFILGNEFIHWAVHIKRDLTHCNAQRALLYKLEMISFLESPCMTFKICSLTEIAKKTQI